LEGTAKDEIRISKEALFKGGSTRFLDFWILTVEKCFPGKRLLKGFFDLPYSSFGEHKLFKTAC